MRVTGRSRLGRTWPQKGKGGGGGEGGGREGEELELEEDKKGNVRIK